MAIQNLVKRTYQVSLSQKNPYFQHEIEKSTKKEQFLIDDRRKTV